MRVRRSLQLALLATVLFAAAYEAIPRTIDAIHTIEERHALAVATAAFARLRLPSDFEPLRSAQCTSYPCYMVPAPAARVELVLPAILASIHARWRELALNIANTPPGYRARPGDRVGPVPGCATTRRAGRAVTNCDIEGQIDGQPVSVFLHPYLAGDGSDASVVSFVSPRADLALASAS
jgi:hypothetical protein